MIENISVLFDNSKIVNAIRKKNKIENIKPSSESIEEAKAKVQKILDSGSSKRRKTSKKEV